MKRRKKPSYIDLYSQYERLKTEKSIEKIKRKHTPSKWAKYANRSDFDPYSFEYIKKLGRVHDKCKSTKKMTT